MERNQCDHRFHQNDQVRRLKTIVEIIEDARVSMASNKNGAKLVPNTRRPETPNVTYLRWSRRYTFAKLLPILPEKNTLSKCRSSSLISVQSEPETRRRPLSPLPEMFPRPQSISGTTEKSHRMGNFVGSRRPLSMIMTSVTCDEAFRCMNNDPEARGFLPALPFTRPSCFDTHETKKFEPIVALKPPLLAVKNRENSFDSGLSTASMEDTSHSLSTDDDRSPRPSARLNEAVRMYMNQLHSFLRKGEPQEAELNAWVESFQSYLSNGKSYSMRGQCQAGIVHDLLHASEELTPKLAVRIYAIILAINVTGKNLITVLKRLYSQCGLMENLDHFNYDLFLLHLLDTMGRLSIEEVVPMLYMARIMDILTSSEQLRLCLLELSICKRIVSFTRLLVYQVHHEIHVTNIPTLAIAIPTFSSIRNLLESGHVAEQDILRHGILQETHYLMDAFCQESELMLYGFRILSKLSKTEACCEQLVILEPDFFQSSAIWLRLYWHDQDAIVRLLFVLGNLLSVVERAQWQLFQVEDVTATLEDIFDHYLGKCQSLCTIMNGNEQLQHGADTVNGRVTTSEAKMKRPKGLDEAEDILVKLTRVIANLGVHPGVGTILCQNEAIIDHLCTLIELGAAYTEFISDEMVINALVALHNLSFYTTADGMNPKIRNRLKEAIPAMIRMNSSEVLSEACCLLSNLTRDTQIAEWVIENKIHKSLILLLSSSSDLKLSKSAAGSLVNLSRCSKYHQILLNDGILKNTFELLKQSISAYNWNLASMALQIISNIVQEKEDCSNWEFIARSVDGCLLKEVALLILKHTDDFTSTCPNELVDNELAGQLRQMWEYEFCSVSTHLLETLDATIT